MATYLIENTHDKPVKPAAQRKSLENGGGRGIRTLGTLARTTVFETAPFNHSGTPPQGTRQTGNHRGPGRRERRAFTSPSAAPLASTGFAGRTSALRHAGFRLEPSCGPEFRSMAFPGVVIVAPTWSDPTRNDPPEAPQP